MGIDVELQYFRMSFRFDKKIVEDFGLLRVGETIINPLDGSLWFRKELFDFGWGNENGFLRLPELQFSDLWFLLTNSTIQENLYGAASLILEKHADELLFQLEEILSTQNAQISMVVKKAFQLLELEKEQNRSPIEGKTLDQINHDFSRWKSISNKIKAVL